MHGIKVAYTKCTEVTLHAQSSPSFFNPILPPTLSPKWPLTCSGSPELCQFLAFCENEILRHILPVARIFPLAWQSRDLSLDGGVNFFHLKIILLLLGGTCAGQRISLWESWYFLPHLTWVPGLELRPWAYTASVVPAELPPQPQIALLIPNEWGPLQNSLWLHFTGDTHLDCPA